MRRVWGLGGAAVILVTLACGGGGGGASSVTPAAPPPPPPLPETEESSADLIATYRVTFDATWRKSSIPGTPSNPHFSPLIGGTHEEGTVFWEPGSRASDGIKDMAERGRTSPLDDEISRAINRGQAEHLLRGGPIGSSPGSRRLEFEIGLDHPYVTLVSMVAPSPDWFVGVSGLSLLEDGDWAESITVELFAYDAGTDGGTDFTSADQPLSPREPIARINGAPFRVSGSLRSLGTFRFKRLN